MSRLPSFDPSSSTSRFVPVPISVPAAPLFAMRSTTSIVVTPKPTSKDVICGIAPHVFDERRKKNDKRSLSSAAPPVRHYPKLPHPQQQHRNLGMGGSTLKSSPLRFSVAISVEGNGSVVLMEPTRTQPQQHPNTVVEVKKSPRPVHGSSMVLVSTSPPITSPSPSSLEDIKEPRPMAQISSGKRPCSRGFGGFLSHLNSTRILKRTVRS